ncbi:DUF58 domain-containing protein [Pengzhenrongella sicca]|uniref:DUF58 domain-containing protein n=1 Tax=Pengzhenrongella sicca TaxID=2819238 RepID=A0A8A4Z8C8_9MICO|nr:DUF58 domain-containing protein [Pengzhenrongella sicca]QTE28122.1 DUF58 domain-containing protein [Pengzhenrongella sicca]
MPGHRPDVSRLAQIRARLELPFNQRAVGLLDGRHLSIYRGQGQDFDDLSLYSPGDDVGDIDWKSSARSGIPIIKRYVRQNNLDVILAVDTGIAMSATAASGEPKAEVAGFAAAVLAFVAHDRGDRVGLVAVDAERTVLLPARGGSAHLELVLRRLEEAYDGAAPAGDLDRLVERVLTLFPRRSLVVLVTDEERPGPEHAQTLRLLRTRHEVLVLAVANADPTGAHAQDVEDGRSWPAFLRGRRGLERAVTDARAERRARAAGVLRDARVLGVVMAGTDDALIQLISMLGQRRHALR